MMSRAFYKQLIFISLGIAILTIGGVIIYGAIPQGNLLIQTGRHSTWTAPVAWWKMDEASWNGTASEVIDSIGTNHGVSANGANTTSTAVFGRAGSFDGVNDYVDAGSPSLPFTGKLSVSAWIFNNPSGSGTIISQGGSGNGPYKRFQIMKYLNALYVYTQNGGSIYYYTDAWPNAADILHSGWNFISVTVDYDGATTTIKKYVDGVLKFDGTKGVQGFGNPAGKSLYIGAYKDSTTIYDFFSGSIDDVRIYNYALTAGQVQQIYNETAKIKMVKQENTTTTGNNPVGWWKMDEGTGQYAYDASGNGNTGTLGTSTAAEPADPTWTTGKLGKGLSFDGSNDCITILDPGTNSIFDITGAVTLSAWVKFNDQTDFQWIVGKYGTYTIARHNNRIDFWTITGNAYSMSPDLSWEVGRWYHIVGLTTDGTTAGVKIYRDGVDVGMTVVLSGALPVNDNGLFIGCEYPTSYHANGLIDDVRIYSRALSAEEVGQMYNSTKDGYLGNIKVSTGLVGYWKLDDNNALTSVIDYSGKGNTGTAYSGTATSTSVLSTSTAMIGRAMSFDGVDDWVVATPTINYNNNWTASVWASASTMNSFHGILSDRNTSGTYFWTLGVYQNVIQMEIGIGAYPIYIKTTYNPVGTGWQYYTVVRNNNDMTIYRNGAVEKTGTMPINLPANYLEVGRWYSGGGFFNGLIDEVKIWNRALTATEIEQDYVRGASHLPY